MKNIQSMYQKQFCIEKYADLLLIGKEGKRHVFIKDLNTFMYDQRLHRAKKTFLLSLLTSFSNGKNNKMSY